jgi:hypothetical protein
VVYFTKTVIDDATGTACGFAFSAFFSRDDDNVDAIMTKVVTLNDPILDRR